MTPEILTHISFIVVALAALITLGLGAIKFIRTVQKSPKSLPPKTEELDHGFKLIRETEIANLREELLDHIKLLGDKIDRKYELFQKQLDEIRKGS